MSETHSLLEPECDDYVSPESKAETPDEDQGKAETRNYRSPDWFSRMPRELAEQALSRYIICQYMLLLA